MITTSDLHSAWKVLHRPLEKTLLVLSWIAIAFVFGYAVHLRFLAPRIPASDPDTWGYLVPAIAWIDGLGFVQSNGRGWFYPAFVTACLRVGDYGALLVAQQALGILSGVFFVLAWRVWTRLLPEIPLLRGAMLLAVTPLLAVFLWNPQTVVFEGQIRPEAVMNIAVFAQLYCVLRYVEARWQGGTAWAMIVFGATGIFLAYVSFELKPSWALAVPLTCLPMGLGMLAGRRLHWPAIQAVGLALVLMLLFQVPKKMFFREDGDSRTFLPMVLFALHADLINADMHQHPEELATDPKWAEFMAEFDQRLENARTKKHNYPVLGFDPDYLMFGSPFFYTVRLYAGGSQEDFVRFCRQAYLNAAKRQTSGLIRKVSSQFSLFTHPKESTLFRSKIDWKRIWETSTESLPDGREHFKGHAGAALLAYREEMKPLALKENIVVGSRACRDIAGSLCRSIHVWQALFLVALVASFVWQPLHSCRVAGAAALVLYGGPLGNALTVSIIHALDISRYRYSYGPPLLLAIGALIVFTVVVAGLAVVRVAGRYLNAKKP